MDTRITAINGSDLSEAISFSCPVVLGPTGPCSGFRVVTIRITTTNKSANNMPGNIPAMNSLPMLSSVRMA